MASAFRLDMDDLRRDVRVTITYRTVIAPIGEAPRHATALNISRFGVLMSCTQPPMPGARLTVRLPFAGDVEGAAVWSMGERVGCQFDTPFAHEDYALILAAMPRD